MTKSQEPFEGFDPPFYTQVPDALFDRFLPELSGAELKVILYIVRRTFGFKKTADNISISQLMTGIMRSTGEPLDYGTGLSRDSVTRATRSLEERGLIVRVRRSSEAKGDQATTYKLRMKGEPKEPEGGVRKSDTGVSENRTAPVRESDTQETVRQDTEEDEIRIRIQSFIEDFSRELKDRAPLSSSVTRAVNIFTQSGLTFPEFRVAMYEARDKTRASAGVRNKMSYFYTVLERDLSAGS